MKQGSGRAIRKKFEAARRWVVRCAAVGFMLGLTATAGAQPTNREVFVRLAQECLDKAPESATAFRLDAGERLAFIRADLVSRWQTAGYVLYEADSSAGAGLPLLRYRIEEAAVRYERAARGALQRSVVLSLTYALTATDGRVVREQPCRLSSTDVIRRSDVERVESPGYPETQAPLPRGGFVRRYLEPAVLLGAVAVGVYLFFSLRSEKVGSP